MPISKEEFDKGRKMAPVERPILTFLKLRPDSAFTAREIANRVRQHTFGINIIWDVTATMEVDRALDVLSKEAKIERKQVGDEVYYRIARASHKRY